MSNEENDVDFTQQCELIDKIVTSQGDMSEVLDQYGIDYEQFVRNLLEDHRLYSFFDRRIRIEQMRVLCFYLSLIPNVVSHSVSSLIDADADSSKANISNFLAIGKLIYQLKTDIKPSAFEIKQIEKDKEIEEYPETEKLTKQQASAILEGLAKVAKTEPKPRLSVKNQRKCDIAQDYFRAQDEYGNKKSRK